MPFNKGALSGMEKPVTGRRRLVYVPFAVAAQQREVGGAVAPYAQAITDGTTATATTAVALTSPLAGTGTIGTSVVPVGTNIRGVSVQVIFKEDSAAGNGNNNLQLFHYGSGPQAPGELVEELYCGKQNGDFNVSFPFLIYTDPRGRFWWRISSIVASATLYIYLRVQGYWVEAEG